MSKNNVMSSNRSFGLVFFAFFMIIGLFPLLLEVGQVKIWAIIISIIFLFFGLINSKFLTPLNKFWVKLGFFLGAFIAPIVMGFVFFIIVTPIGIFMRILGKDLLKKKYEKNLKTYWIKHDKKVGTMKQQF